MCGGLHTGEVCQKTGGARPGMVIYTTYRTVNVTPGGDLVRRLQNGNKQEKRAP